MLGAGKVLVVRLEALEGRDGTEAMPGDRTMEFHVSRKAREELGLDSSLFQSTGNLIIPDFAAARGLARRINEKVDAALLPERAVRAGRLNAMALIDEILHDVARLYREKRADSAFAKALEAAERAVGASELDSLLLAFVRDFPPLEVHRGRMEARAWLDASPGGIPNRVLAAEELLLLRLANENPAFEPYRFLFDDGSREGHAPEEGSLAARPAYAAAMEAMDGQFALLPPFGPDDEDLVTMMRAPVRAAPYSLPGQLDFIRRKWGLVLGERLLRLLGALDLIREEEKPRFPGPGPTRAYVYRGMEVENERFSPDKDWMPNVVMMAKSTLVWLHQLSRAYGRDIRTLDAIPDEELDSLALRGFNGLWLIGLWERSQASAEIKRRCGNPEAASSAYSLFDYEIAGELGGWAALEGLRARCAWRGIRLAADMVPNHTGIDSAWVRERPEVFMRRDDCPFPGYSFNGPDLSGDGRVGIWLEDHYWDRSDAAVVFKRLDRRTGKVDYIYHGNDGTGLPWSDTAQIDFLSHAGREAVKERILHVARNFPIIRFDAAMVLAKKHFRRLWYPEPGSGGDVPSRAEYAMDKEAFDRANPEEFWREVVDMCAKETPDTLLLAEAFWMMEGYFVRSLGMHRVYNSAFMNMLKREENAKYRETIKNTQEFDKDILKRFVNFMNNPDEETAVAQFGKGDKYFGVCTMMATMPGLPMFGHGQLEGFEEKYGMEYRRAYRDETPDAGLIERHEREIFPLLKRRRLFSGVERFLLYDLVQDDGSVNENVFAWSNGHEDENALVVYNNAYGRVSGRIKDACAFVEKLPGGHKRLVRRSLAEALGLHAAPPAPGEAGRFLVMREDRSGLWFLRRSREVLAAGLAIHLDGYQSQVFLDLFEVQDDARGLYAALCDSLGGAGVPDISEALEDLALKDLYASFAAFVNRGLFTAARSLVAGGQAAALRRKEAKALAESLAAPALDFYARVQRLLLEEAVEDAPDLAGAAEATAMTGAAKTAGAVGAQGSPTVAGGPASLAAREAALAPLRARDNFLSCLLALAEAAVAAEVGPEAEKPDGAPASFIAMLRKPWGAETAAAWAVLEGLVALAGRTRPGAAARRIEERIFLERKLRETLRAIGMPGDEAWRALSFASTFLARSGELEAIMAASGEGQASRARRVQALFVDDEELRHKLGVNLFEGIEWFRKEGFGEALEAGAKAAVLSGLVKAQAPAPAPAIAPVARDADAGAKPAPAAGLPKADTALILARIKAVEGIVAALREAELASGYRLDEFRRALADMAGEEAFTPPKAGPEARGKKNGAASAKPDKNNRKD